MLTYTTLTFGFLLTMFFFRINTHLLIKEAAIDRFNRWNSLNQMVSTTQNGKYTIALISLKLILQTMYISFTQYMNASVRKLNRKVYEITYVINGKIYKMVTIPKRGPAPVLQISDDEQNDVTSHILPYMGPQYDWHGNKLTPEFFGHKSLTFELSDGKEYTYEGNNILDVSP